MLLFTLVSTPFVAFVFELCGRLLPLSVVMILSVFLIFMTPRVAPNFMMLCLIRSMIGISNTLVNAAPLAIDYVKQESRGRAVTMNAVCVALSQLFASQIYVPLTNCLEYKAAYATVAGITLLLSVIALSMTAERKVKFQDDKSNISGGP